MMNLALLYSSPTEPVTLQEAKDFLAVEHALHDQLITALITAARQRAEEYCNRSFVEKRYMLEMDALPLHGSVKLPRPPVRQVISVRYLTDGSFSKLDSDKYNVTTSGIPVRLTFKERPSVDPGENTIKIEYITGYDVQGAENTPVEEPVPGSPYPDRTIRFSFPEPVKTAIKMMVRTMYDHRDDYVIGAAINQVPQTSEYLMKDYRIFEFM